MRSHQALGLTEHLRGRRAFGTQVVNAGIVKLEKGQVQLRDNQVHIVTWITKQRSPLAIPGQILEFFLIIDADQKFGGIVKIIEVGTACWPCSIERLEIEAGRARGAQIIEPSVMEQAAAIRGKVRGGKLPPARAGSKE